MMQTLVGGTRLNGHMGDACCSVILLSVDVWPHSPAHTVCGVALDVWAHTRGVALDVWAHTLWSGQSSQNSNNN